MVVNPSIIFCALDCEAKIFIDVLKLKKINQISHYKVYRNSDFILIITGTSEKNIPIAIGLLKGLYPEVKGPFINFGIAGHKNEEIGKLFIINESRKDNNPTFYLNPSKKPSISFGISKTFTSPKRTYEESVIHDMECYSFIESLLTFHPIDQIHILKCISDNEQNSISNINPENVYQLCKKQKDAIFSYIDSLNKEFIDPTYKLLNEFKLRFHLSETLIHELKRLLERSSALGHSNDYPEFDSYDDLKEYLETFINYFCI